MAEKRGSCSCINIRCFCVSDSFGHGFDRVDSVNVVFA